MNLKTDLAPYKKAALSFGGLYSAFECFFVVFLFTYLRLLVPALGVGLIGGVVIVVSVVLMPAVHCIVNRTHSAVLGRYHGTLLVATLLGSLAFWILFNIPPEGAMAYKVTLSVIMLLLLTLAMQTFSYCVFSITVRVTTRGDRFVPIVRGSLQVVSVAAVMALMFFYFDYTAESIGKMAGYVGVMMLIAGLSVYFSTYTVIPKLVGTSKITFKKDYGNFFKQSRTEAFSYAGRYFSMAALFTVCLSVIMLSETLWHLPPAGVGAALTTAAIVGGVLKIVFFRNPSEPAHYRMFSIIGGVLFIVGLCSATLTPLFVELERVYAYIVLCVSAGLVGVAYAFIGIAGGGYMERAYAVGKVTRGTHKCLKGMMTTAAISTAVVVLSIVDAIVEAYSSVIVTACCITGCAAAFCIVGAILSVKGERFGSV